MEGRRYTFELAEPISPTVEAAFPELRVEQRGAATVLCGPARDDAELAGLLERFFTLGLTITTMRRLPE